MHSESIIEYVLVNFRWVFVVLFLLPCTVVGKVWATFEKNLWSRRRLTGLDHEKKVQNIQCEVNICILYYVIILSNFIFFSKKKECAFIVIAIIERRPIVNCYFLLLRRYGIEIYTLPTVWCVRPDLVGGAWLWLIWRIRNACST